jgi:hypothetical protein
MSGRQRDNPFPLGRQERADAYVQRASPTLDEGCTSCTTLLMCESCLRATSGYKAPHPCNSVKFEMGALNVRHAESATRGLRDCA